MLFLGLIVKRGQKFENVSFELNRDGGKRI